MLISEKQLNNMLRFHFFIFASTHAVSNFPFLFILPYMPFSSSLYIVIYLLQIVSNFIYGYMIMQPSLET
jgi:hypothetical protein